MADPLNDDLSGFVTDEPDHCQAYSPDEPPKPDLLSVHGKPCAHDSHLAVLLR